jgi:FixJ family two-component response regulator
MVISGHGDMETAINTMRLGAIIFQNHRFKPIVEYGSNALDKNNS